MLNPQGCRVRRERLRRKLEADRLDLFVTGNYRTVYYFTGVLAAPETPVLYALWREGGDTLASSAAAGDYTGRVVALEGYSIARSITHPFHEAARVAGELLGGPPARRAAVEIAATPAILEAAVRAALPGCELADATDLVLALRRRKEEDEIEEIRRSLRVAAAAYRAARAVIRPGATELDVHSALYRAAVEEMDTSVAFPGDFASGERCIRGGGPPVRRELRPGDLYILDLFPAPALYFGDVCRTFAVGPPTDAQQRAWEAVREAQRVGERAVRPGVSARAVYAEVKAFLDGQAGPAEPFWHHAGHGIGHNGHEAPRIIPGSDDVFETGDVFTLEPGLYGAALGGGIRLEDNYVLRETGLENLFDFPLEL